MAALQEFPGGQGDTGRHRFWERRRAGAVVEGAQQAGGLGLGGEADRADHQGGTFGQLGYIEVEGQRPLALA